MKMLQIFGVGLTLTIFLLPRIDATFFGLENLFGNGTVKDCQVYWNVPTFMCHQYGMYFEEVSRDFGIIQNQRDDFRGNEVAILYDPGMFPALLKNPDGSLMKRNGGVPQEGDLTRHLDLFRKHLVEQITNESFSGIGIIDFESWRPIFRQNWASLEPYRTLSIKISREKHPFWNDRAVKKESVRVFEKYGRIFMEESLKTAKNLRPQASWGYYAYPYCFNLTPHQTSSQCDPKVREENDEMSWLFKAQDVLFPSVYLRMSLSGSEKIGLINGRVKEAMRISKKSRPNTKVLPYFWYKYQDRRDVFLSREDTVDGLREIVDLAADGVIIWGSSNDLNSRSKCRKFRDYLNDVLGPAVTEFKEMSRQRVNQEENSQTSPSEMVIAPSSINVAQTR